MDNTQINITTNGTKTLATAGKYCDRNIVVNVAVPASGITPSGNKTITTNGTHDVTQYANAVVDVPVPSGYVKPSGSKTITENGTHDVTNYASAVVSVTTAQPTQFTNLFDITNVTHGMRVDANSSIGYQYNEDVQCNYIKIPFHHVPNEPVVMRLRGIGTIRDRNSSITLAEDGETKVNHYTFTIAASTQFEMSYDEYGDAMVTFKGVLLTAEWYYFVFNFQYFGVIKNATAMQGPIITINEPIGNGGYVGGN